MKVVYLFLCVLIVSLVLAFIDYRGSKIYCRKCKSKMNKDFNVEEDCEEYVCPNCGHKFKIYG